MVRDNVVRGIAMVEITRGFMRRRGGLMESGEEFADPII